MLASLREEPSAEERREILRGLPSIGFSEARGGQEARQGGSWSARRPVDP